LEAAMRKLKIWLFRFFSGRYGTDTLNKTLTWIYIGGIILCTVLSYFISSPWFHFFYYIGSMAMMIWIFFRMFSRNIVARRRENEKFCGFFKLRRNKFRDRKTHVYRKCPQCKAVLRLPRSKGKHFVVCPRCKNRFEVKG
jgi:hypothetical protein